ncbi:MAG: Hsp20/alpha crystallin family protein [archaeon]
MEWNPFGEMREFQKRMNKAFEDFFKKPRMKSLSVDAHSPLSDVIDKGNQFIVKVDLPGVEKEDIILNTTERSVEVRAEKKREVKIQKKGYYRHERSYGGFYRVVPLPSFIDPDSAKASYKNGVLEIKVKKSKTKKVSKKVRVE